MSAKRQAGQPAQMHLNVELPANLEAIGDNLFITRLPFTYRETDRVISEAVRRGEWEAVGTEAEASGGRKAASYRARETAINLYGRSYRAIVVH